MSSGTPKCGAKKRQWVAEPFSTVEPRDGNQEVVLRRRHGMGPTGCGGQTERVPHGAQLAGERVERRHRGLEPDQPVRLVRDHASVHPPAARVEDNVVVAEPPRLDEGVHRRQRGMARVGDLPRRREPPEAPLRFSARGRREARGARDPHLGGDRLQLRVGETLRVEHHRGGITAEDALGENVHLHDRDHRRMRSRSWRAFLASARVDHTVATDCAIMP